MLLIVLAALILVMAAVVILRAPRRHSSRDWRYRLSRFIPVRFASIYASYHEPDAVMEGFTVARNGGLHLSTKKRTTWFQWRDRIMLERTRILFASPATT